MSAKTMEHSEATLERRIRVATSGPERVADLDLLRSRDGVIAVAWNGAAGTLAVTYDARDTSYAELAHWLVARGWTLDRGWLARWRAGLYRFIDGNVRDNARTSPACCNRPPPGAGKFVSRDR